MRTRDLPPRSRASRLLAWTTATLVVASGLIIAPQAASAAEGAAVSDATLDWGFRENWRNYVAMFGGTTELSGGASESPAPYNWGTGDAGVYDEETGQGSFTAPGSVRWHGWHGIDITLATPTVSFDLAAGTGEVLVSDLVIATFTTAGAGVSTGDGAVSVSGAPTVAGAGASAFFGEAYSIGTVLDPVSFRLDYEVAALPTVTTVAADATDILVGEQVTLTATVSPAVDGEVTFVRGSDALADPVPVSGGTASLTVPLAAGTHEITAVFASHDPGYEGSTAETPVTITVSTPAEAKGTVTTVDPPAPAAPALLGVEVVLSATVAEEGDETAHPAGAVEFFSIADGTTERTPLGSATVGSDGVATLSTTALAAGGHGFVAVFTPAVPASFLGSEGARTANYGVVDPAAPAPYVPGDNAQTTSGATASWNWSDYSSGWVKTADGDATVNGQSFELSDGEVLADAGGAVISFGATLTTTAYGSFVVELTDPALHLRSDGSGVWVAAVNGSEERVVVGTFAGVDARPAEAGEREVQFDWADTTASGTWSAGRTAAWPNGFILEVPSSIRSFYYASGANGDPTKPAAPLTVEFDWPAVSETALAVTPSAPLVLGGEAVLTATVTPSAAAGEVEFFTTVGGLEESLGTAAVNDGSAVLRADDLAAGGHTFRAVFTASNDFAGSEARTTANYGVVDPAQVPVCTPDPDAAETLSGVTARWAWNAYSSGWVKEASGDVTVDGRDFVLSRGIATVDEGCTSIAFTGALTVTAYGAYAVTLTDPVIAFDEDGNGAWSAIVSSSVEGEAVPAGERTVVAAISGAEVPDFHRNVVDAEVGLAWTDTTAAGTWSAGRTSAWSNAFILQVPSAIRSFYYASGANADGNKPAAPVSLAWELPSLTGTVNGQHQDARVLQGQTVTFTASPFRAGDEVSVVIGSDPVTLPSVVVGRDGVATQTWTVPADFATGAHTVTLAAGERSISLPFAVETTTTPDVTPAPEVCVARAVTGGSMDWGFKQSFRSYIEGPIAKGSFSGGGFTASGGAINVNAGGIGRVNFGGTITATGHGGELDLRIADVSVQITGPSSGVLYGTLTQGGTGGYMAIADLSFSSVSVGDSGLRVSGSSATLTGSAAAAFGGFYSAGTALDPVSFSVALGGEVACDSSTDPEGLAVTGGGLTGAGWAAALLLLAGAGLVAIRRRRATV